MSPESIVLPPVSDADSAPNTDAENDQELQTVIELPSGAIARKKPLKGRVFFQFQAKAKKNAVTAMQWIVLQAFEVNGKPLDIDTLEDEMSFEDAAILTMEITKAFLPYLPQDNSSP